jgi:mannose-6-phosphate isomerase-like protein (cupin superfamily)
MALIIRQTGLRRAILATLVKARLKSAPLKGATMKRDVSIVSIGLAGFLLSVSGTHAGFADDATPKIRFFSAAQLRAQVAHPAKGIAGNQFLNGPGSIVYILRRDKTGEAEVHMAFNDIYVVQSGHAKITVGGQVTGNRETLPTEWLGGDISGGTDYALAPGDVLFIPAGVPHKVLVSPNSGITYVLVKTPK